MKEWYKLLNYWRRGDGDGDDTAQDRDDGTGDLLFNTLSKIVMDRDRSLWAIMAFLACAASLIKRERWLNEFNIGNEASSRWLWYPYKWIVIFLKWLGVNVTLKWSRPQSDMTRDPFKTFGTCYMMLITGDLKEYQHVVQTTFEAVTIPWYIYRPNMWTWWRRLKKDGRKHFVKRLDYFAALAIVMKFEKYDENDFYKDSI